jgi:nucleoside-diphosphate-sugar epimerase
MRTLFCFGFGYCARHYGSQFGARYDRIVGTVRAPEQVAQLASQPGSGTIEVLRFEPLRAADNIVAALHGSDALLVSVPPQDAVDPVLETYSGVLAQASRLATIVYLSSVGVYGDHHGAMVNETTVPQPHSARGQARLAAEVAWRNLGQRANKPVAILRLAGIYGPQRNALASLGAGRARRIVKPGQVFNRVHVGDIAQAIAAAFERRAGGVFNVADDEPGPPQDVIAFAAALLGREPPQELPFATAQASMSPLARSFYGDNKRVSNAKLKAELGVRLRYPTYRDGLRALVGARPA